MVAVEHAILLKNILERNNIMENIDYKKIIRRFSDAGIRLWVDGEKLKFSASKTENGTGGMDEEKLAFLKAHKNEIIVELKKDENRFLLTDIQSAYLLGRMDTFDYGGVSCKIYLEIDYEELDKERCQWAWNKLVERHEMLRAIICDDGYQVIPTDTSEIEVKYYDFTSDIEGLAKLREEMSDKVFPIGAWPYFEIALSKQKEKTVMHISFDFLIADWNSIWILIREFEDFYFNGETKKKVPLSFQDYLSLENEMISKPEGLRDKEYWKKRIENLPPRPMLPVKDKSCIESGFDRLIFELPKNKWDKFCEYVNATGCTPTAAVMTCYALCLGNWSQIKEFCINLTLLNRLPLSPDVYSIVGDFTSVSLLEVNLQEKESFAKLTKRIQSQMMMDLDHRLFSGVKTMREYSIVHGKDASLFPYVFTGSIGLVNTGNFKGKISGYGKSSTPQVFIDCQAMDGPDGLRINWDVRRGVFDSKLLESMFECFKNLLEKLADDSRMWEKEELILVPSSQLEVRNKVNATEKIFNKKTLFEMVWDAMNREGTKVAVIDQNESITYGELKNRVCKIAGNLKSMGIKNQDTVGVLVDKQVNQISAVLAVLALGGIYVPIDREQPYQRIKGIVDKAEIKVCICNENKIMDMGEGGKCIPVSELLESGENNWDIQAYQGKGQDIAYIIFTSGSTGIPKGVQISNHAAANTILDVNDRFNVGKTDKVLALSKLNFDLSVYDIFGILSVGGTLVFPDEEQYLVPSHWQKLILKHGITVWNTVPAFMSMLMEYCESTEEVLPIKLVLMSGDWIPVTLPQQIRNHTQNPLIVSLGGATEASIWSNYYICKPEENFEVSIPYGYPLSNQGFYIADKWLKPVPDYVPGELCIYGAGLAEGYLKDDEQNESHFVYSEYLGRNIYRTGDYGYYRKDGVMIFLGRRDAQVKIRGHRIELGEIEKTLMKADAVEEACAVVVERAGNSKEILAIVTSKTLKIKDKSYRLIEDAITKQVVQYDDNTNHNWTICRDRAALAAMFMALKEVGILGEGKKINIAEACNVLQVKEQYRWLLKYWIMALYKAKMLNKEGDLYSISVGGENLDLGKLLEELKISGKQSESAFGQYIVTAFENAGAVLKGTVNPVELLYPQGSTKVLESLYVQNNTAKIFNEMVATACITLAKNKKKTFRILEIGGGSAATSRCVLSALKKNDIAYEYYFSDVAESFMAEAKGHLKDYQNVHFQCFDMDRDYREQGIKPSYFDVVIATGVIENAKDIKYTLNLIKEVLVSGGYLLATEPVKEENWILAAQAFMMTKPCDELRKDMLYLDEDAWRELLTNEMSGDLAEYPPRGEACGNLKLWIKQMSSEFEYVDEEELMRITETYLPEYMIPGQIQVVSHFPLTGNGKIDRKTMKNWYVERTDEEQRDDIEESDLDEFENQVASIIAGALGIEHIQVDRDLYEYGIDSLVQAQVAGKLKTYADERFKTDAVTFDRILRIMLNGTSTRELATFIKESCAIAESVSSNEKEESIGETSRESELGEFTMLQEGDGTLLVLLPPALGTLSGISELIEAIKGKAAQPVAALTIKNADCYTNIQSDDVIGKVADCYTELLKQTGRQEFRLIGYCMGGFLALEIARRLQEEDIAVEKLIMIDSTPILEEIEDDVLIEFLFLNGFYMAPGKIFNEVSDEEIVSAIEYIFKANNRVVSQDSYRLLEGKKEYERVFKLWKKLKTMKQEERFEIYTRAIAGDTKEKATLEMITEQYEVYAQSFKASKLETENYFGDMLFLKATEEQPYVFLDREAAVSFWKEVCIGDVEVECIPGNHDSCIEGKNAESIAKILLQQ